MSYDDNHAAPPTPSNPGGDIEPVEPTPTEDKLMDLLLLEAKRHSEILNGLRNLHMLILSQRTPR